MKLIAYYTGSDARWLTSLFPTDIRKIPYILFTRLRARLLRPLVREYWLDDEYLAQFIRRWNPKAVTRVVPDDLRYIELLPKVPHKEFNIMYYYPVNEYNHSYCRWCYGKDVVEEVVRYYKNHPHVRFIRVDGTQDLMKVFPHVDFYLRPNRHDGASRLVRECAIQGIPVYHTHCDPSVADATKKIDMLLYLKYGNLEPVEPNTVDLNKVN